MKELKFKTSLKCGGCKEKITPGMNGIDGIEKWDVDLSADPKILTVKTDESKIREVMEVVEKEGFTIEQI